MIYILILYQHMLMHIICVTLAIIYKYRKLITEFKLPQSEQQAPFELREIQQREG
jgi:hypothetical protein